MMQDCSPCFWDYLVQCEDTIQVNALLEPATEYKWVITDKFERQYEGTVTTDADGYFAIPTEELPAGLLTEYSGNFRLQVYGADGCTPVKFLIAQEYNQIHFNIQGGTRVKNTLGCAM